MVSFTKKHNVFEPLMDAESWNNNTKELVVDNDLYNPDNKTWVIKMELSKIPKPSIQKKYKCFVGNY